MTWVWLTLRRPIQESVAIHDHGNSIVGLLAAMERHVEKKVTGYTDHACLLDMDSKLVAWERGPNTDMDFPMIVLTSMLADETITLADTLDEFAARVGAPPRPRAEIPDVFRDAAPGAAPLTETPPP